MIPRLPRLRASLRSLLSITIAALVLCGTSPAFAFDVTMNATAEPAARPVVHGTTNLPDGAVLTVTVSRGGSAVGAPEKTIVQHGAFTAGPFSDAGSDLAPGTYKLDVLMEMSLQPAEVRRVVGSHGMQMAGRLTRLGTTGQYVAYALEFTVAGEAAKPQGASEDSWVAENCATRLDFVNRTVRAKAVSGHEIVGSERDAWMAECIKRHGLVPDSTQQPP